MGGSENLSNGRHKGVDVLLRQKAATKFSAAKSTAIIPPQSVIVDFGDGTTAVLNAIRTGGSKEDNPDSCNMVEFDVGGGDGSSSAVSIRLTMQKIVQDVDEDEDDENPNCKQNGDEANTLFGGTKRDDLQLEYVKPVVNNVNGSVMIPSDVVNKGSLPYSRTLYGYFFGEEIDFPLVDYHIRNMWKAYGIEDMMMYHKGFYFFKFNTDQGMLDALENGTWTIRNVPIFLKRWRPGLILDKSQHDKLPVWIKIYDMPLELWNRDGLNIIASMLGNPLSIDTCTSRMCMNASGRAGYARVLVDVDATGNWPDKISVSVPYGNGYSLSTLPIEYSWKPANCSFCKVYDHTDNNCIHQLNEIKLTKEEQEKDAARRYKAEAHLYTIIKVARNADMLKQIGNDIYFDLVNHDKVRNFRIQNEMPFNLFKEEVAKDFGVPVHFQRFWMWAKRKNNTYRPNRFLMPQEETQLVGQLRQVSNKNDNANANAELKLFLEIEIGLDLHILPPPDISEEDILVFFKLYKPEKEELRYAGSFFVKGYCKPTEIISKLNESVGFSPHEEIELYEEIKFEPNLMCERLDTDISFRSSQIGNGDIICFQKLSQAQAGEKYRYPDVPSYMRYVKNLHVHHA